MTFFHDLTKRLADIGAKQEQQQIAESKKAEAVAQSPLTQALNESAVAEAGYSAKAARAGKDIGKPGKNFDKVAKKAGGGEKGEILMNISFKPMTGSNVDAASQRSLRMIRADIAACVAGAFVIVFAPPFAIAQDQKPNPVRLPFCISGEIKLLLNC